jgi:hypothetical protein
MAATTLGIRTVTLAAGTPASVAPSGNRLRAIINIGVNPATIGTSNSVAAGVGIPLAAAPTAGGQGGGYSFGDVPTLQSDLYAVSTLGTRLCLPIIRALPPQRPAPLRFPLAAPYRLGSIGLVQSILVLPCRQ